jgi:hypothetical protein
MMDTQTALRGFPERMKAMLIFQPLLNLANKQKFSEIDGLQLDLPSLGLSVLLFILENMLQSNRDSTHESISYFLRETISSAYGKSLTYDEALELTRMLVSELRNDGQPFELPFYNLEKGGSDAARFHLIDYEDYNIRDKTVRLKLSIEGLDLLFKTREVYQELKISITQLYLRQQIVKGVFDGALRTIQELRLQVNDLKEEIERMKERIRTDAQKVSSEPEYRRLVDRVRMQLEREHEVFQELGQLIDQTIEKSIHASYTRREEVALEKITAVKRELQRVIVEHDHLFSEKLDVNHLMMTSLENSIIYAFRTRLNFEREVLLPAVTGMVRTEFFRRVIDPVIPVAVPSRFNLMELFQDHILLTRSHSLEDKESLPIIDEEVLQDEIERERQERLEKEARIYSYLNLILSPLIREESTSLNEVFKLLRSEDMESYETIINRMDFYPFLVELHQMKEIELRHSDELDVEIVDTLPRMLVKLTEGRPGIREIDKFQVEPTEEILRLENGYVITNFKIKRSS